MDFSTLRYLNHLLDQEIALAQSLRDTIGFLNTDTGLMVMSVQLKAMMARIAIIKEMADCRMKSTNYPEAPQEEADAVFERLGALLNLGRECTDALANRQFILKEREQLLMQTLG